MELNTKKMEKTRQKDTFSIFRCLNLKCNHEHKHIPRVPIEEVSQYPCPICDTKFQLELETMKIICLNLKCGHIHKLTPEQEKIFKMPVGVSPTEFRCPKCKVVFPNPSSTFL